MDIGAVDGMYATPDPHVLVRVHLARAECRMGHDYQASKGMKEHLAATWIGTLILHAHAIP